MGVEKLSIFLIVLLGIHGLVAQGFENTQLDTKTYQNERLAPLRGFSIHGDSLFVSGKGGIAIVNISNDDLKETTSSTQYGHNWLLLYNDRTHRVVQCSEDKTATSTSTCSELYENLTTTDKSSSSMKVNLTYLPTYVKSDVGGSLAVVIGASSIELMSRNYAIMTLDVNNFSLFKTEPNENGPMNLELGTPEYGIVFKAAIAAQEYIYFFYQIFKDGNYNASRVGKMCKSSDKTPRQTGYFHSYEDMELHCQQGTSNFSRIENAVISNDAHFIVLFGDDNADNNMFALCIYNISELPKYFSDGRKSQLKCGRTKKGTYFKPSLDNLSSPNCNGPNGNCIDPNNEFCQEVKGDFCNTKLLHTVWDSDGPVKNATHVEDARISTMKLHKLDNYITLYLGTETGKIVTIYMMSTVSKLLPITRREYTASNEKIIGIEADNSSVYVMSGTQIKKINFGDCSIYHDCSSCLQSFSPFCGWNTVKKRCTTDTVEPSGILYIKPLIGRCINLNVKPESIWIENGNTVTKISFELPKSYTYEIEHNISCNVIGSNIAWYKERDTCETSNTTKHITPGTYNFTVMFNGETVAVDSIEFFECKQFQSCIECTSKEECLWIQINATCDRIGSSLKQPSQCLSIISDESNMPKYYGNSNVTVKFDLRMNISQIPYLVCEASSANFSSIPNRTVVARVENDSVFCPGFNLEVFEDITSHFLPQFYSIRLIHNNSVYVNGSFHLEAYTCMSALRNKDSCEDCKQISLKYPTPCLWCEEKISNRCFSADLERECKHVNTICNVTLISVTPKSGPTNGGTVVLLNGTNFGRSGDLINVTLGEYPCTDIRPTIDNGLRCETSKVSGEENIFTINITVNQTSFTFPQSENWFSYKKPKVSSFHPNKSIQSGGRLVTISGKNIGFDGPNRYEIMFCDQFDCVQCRFNSVLDNNNITCRSDKVITPRNMTRLKLTVDRRTTLVIEEPFFYVMDPTEIVLSNKTASVQQSGGAKIKVDGQGFSNVGEVTIDRVEKPCDITSDTLVECETPPFAGNQSITDKVTEKVNVYFDDLAVEVTVEYTGDPSFQHFSSMIEYDKESAIEIRGHNLLQGARQEDYTILIGLDGSCYIQSITDKAITCYPPKTVPRTSYDDENKVDVIVKVGKIKEHVGYLKYEVEVPVTIIVIVALAVSLAIAVVTGVGATLTMKWKRRYALKEFKLELQNREEIIKQRSREEFADTQITLKDIKSDLVTSRVPYWDFQMYILLQLFPNQDPMTNPICIYSEMMTDDAKSKHKSAFEKLDLLLQNKLFLKSLIQTLDRPNKLTVQEKAQFGSVLSVSLLGNMRLFFDLVHCLLLEKVQSATKKQHKGLFRRFDSIVFRLMANWLHVALYQQLMSQSGIQLFMLFRAVQTIIERAPIDAVTGNSKYTLAEEKLLKLKVDCETITLQIDLNGKNDHIFPVKVLCCDTISQVKRKCCSQIYKNKPGSEIPKFEELSLEWKEGKAGRLLLQDIDNTSERMSGLVRLNTLKHYNVKDNCRMALFYGDHAEEDIYVNRNEEITEDRSLEDVNLLLQNDIETDEFTQKWHLECVEPNIPDEQKSNIEQNIGDIYLNRLFHTKLLLSDYIDSTFEGLMDRETLSVPIKYFLYILDKIGKDNLVDQDVIQMWKSECFATRIWASLIGKPQTVFDVHVPAHVEPVMDILSQVFVESFTQTNIKVSKDSEPQKLLFHKDIPRYRKNVYSLLGYTEQVEDDVFYKSLDEMSEMQKKQLTFSRQATMNQLYNLYIATIRNDILMDLEDMEESNDFQFATKLEEVFALMDE